MMDLDEPDNVGRVYDLEESSGSAYEISDEEQSHDENAGRPSASRAGSERGRSHSVTKSHGRKGRTGDSASKKYPSESPTREVFENAVEWAASFKEPKVEDIKTPQRLSRGGKKRKAHKPATEIRVKRLKAFYNNDYRELLNSEIQDAASRVADSGRLKQSQIGSSIWTVVEKAILFTALERFGRGDVRGIAGEIGSKSQHQVQEYASLLHQGMMEKKQNVYRLLVPADLPAAVEVSDECAAVLERAGDALAVHQERAEEKVEKDKWGDSWLINQDVASQMDKRRKQKSGEDEMEEVLPAANLLDLSNWIDLSDRIFMNSGSPREEDNWQNIAEPGESPAVRATAFEDFHSLAFNITKRLVSTAVFCSMSRLRAKGSNKAKHAEVNTDDVEAAVNILGLKANSHDSWCGVAKRCSLQVVNDDDDDDNDDDDIEPVLMSYDQVDKALRERHPRSHSRSASRSRSIIWSDQPESSRHPAQAEDLDSSTPDIHEGEHDSDSQSEYASLPDSDKEYMSSPPPSITSSSRSSIPRSKSIPPVSDGREAAEDAHTEACDMYASQTEEIRLWNLLKQAPPFDFTLAPAEGKAPKGGRDELAERENWRDHVGFVNEWEEMDSPVTEEAFARNRNRVSRIAKRKAVKKETDGNNDLDLEEDEEDEYEDESVEHEGEQRDLATAAEPEDLDQDSDVADEDEHLQVESPRQQSSDSQSPDRESEFSHGAMIKQLQRLAAEGFVASDDEDEEDPDTN